MNAGEFETILERERERQRIVVLSLAEPRERPAPHDDLRAFEQEFGCVFPASYRYFAMLHGCGDFIFTAVLSPLPESIFHIGNATCALGPHFLPIAENGCGDYYGFPCEAGICRDSIVFTAHEKEYATQPANYKDFFSFLVADGLRANDRDA